MKTATLLRSPLAQLAAMLLPFLAPASHLEAAAPVVSNVRASQRAGTQLVDIYYNVSAATATVRVAVLVSADGGTIWNVPATTFTGAYGPGVTTGNDRLLTWNAGLDWGGHFSTACRVRVLADDGTAPPAPAGMAYIPAGSFQMGDTFHEGNTSELPLHNVFVSAFFMDKNQVIKEMWLDVYTWAQGHGYTFSNAGSFAGNGYPVKNVNWYDVVKWCNARSEQEGLTPCYYTDATLATVYRVGSLNLTNACVKWTVNGYRLPTEAEWEKAARGGRAGNRFPWGDTITHSQANYFSSASYGYDLSPTRGAHPTYGAATGPIRSFAANDYGLFDMAGNQSQWCWDWFDGLFYGQTEATNDPHGPVGAMSYRVMRGGDASDAAVALRCASRYNIYGNVVPAQTSPARGFRCVRGY